MLLNDTWNKVQIKLLLSRNIKWCEGPCLLKLSHVKLARVFSTCPCLCYTIISLITFLGVETWDSSWKCSALFIPCSSKPRWNLGGGGGTDITLPVWRLDIPGPPETEKIKINTRQMWQSVHEKSKNWFWTVLLNIATSYHSGLTKDCFN